MRAPLIVRTILPVVLVSTAAFAAADPTAAASRPLHRPLLPVVPIGKSLKAPKLPIFVAPIRPAPARPKLPIRPVGPAKLPPQKTYPYAPGTTVNDHRNGLACSYVVGDVLSWNSYARCEAPRPLPHHWRPPPPPWPY